MKIKNVALHFAFFLLLYLAVGYFLNNFGISINWVQGTTWFDKMYQYYFASAPLNLIITTMLYGIIFGVRAMIKRIINKAR